MSNGGERRSEPPVTWAKGFCRLSAWFQPKSKQSNILPLPGRFLRELLPLLG